MKKLKFNDFEKGFTIIEVVLVLAIAGLIFLAIFVALPALQMSQRNEQRKRDMGEIASAVQTYKTNNKGMLPEKYESLKPYLRSDIRDPDGDEYHINFVCLYKGCTFWGGRKNSRTTSGMQRKSTYNGIRATRVDIKGKTRCGGFENGSMILYEDDDWRGHAALILRLEEGGSGYEMSGGKYYCLDI